MKYEVLEKLKSIPYSDNQVDMLETLFDIDPSLHKRYEDILQKLYQSWVDFGNDWDKKYDALMEEIKNSHWENTRNQLYDALDHQFSRDPKIVTAEYLTGLKNTGDLYLSSNITLRKTDEPNKYVLDTELKFREIVSDDNGALIGIDFLGIIFITIGFKFMGKFLEKLEKIENTIYFKFIDDDDR